MYWPNAYLLDGFLRRAGNRKFDDAPPTEAVSTSSGKSFSSRFDASIDATDTLPQALFKRVEARLAAEGPLIA